MVCRSFPLILVALLAGCANLGTGDVNVAALSAQAHPIPMFTMDCEGYVVLTGLPAPIGLRMKELDAMCPVGRSAAAAVPSAPSSRRTP